MNNNAQPPRNQPQATNDTQLQVVGYIVWNLAKWVFGLLLLVMIFRPLVMAHVTAYAAPDVMIRIPQPTCSVTMVGLPQKTVHLAFVNGPMGDDDVLEMLVDTLLRYDYTASFFVSNETYLSPRALGTYRRALAQGNTLEIMVSNTEHGWPLNLSIDDMATNISSTEAFIRRITNDTLLDPTITTTRKKYIWSPALMLVSDEQNAWFKENHYQRLMSAVRRIETIMPVENQAYFPWPLIVWNIKSWFWQLEIFTALYSTNVPAYYGNPVIALDNARYSIPVLQDLLYYWASHGWQVSALPSLDLVAKQSGPHYCRTLHLANMSQ